MKGRCSHTESAQMTASPWAGTTDHSIVGRPKAVSVWLTMPIDGSSMKRHMTTAATSEIA